jgi:hypothetical protein
VPDPAPGLNPNSGLVVAAFRADEAGVATAATAMSRTDTFCADRRNRDKASPSNSSKFCHLYHVSRPKTTACSHRDGVGRRQRRNATGGTPQRRRNRASRHWPNG